MKLIIPIFLAAALFSCGTPKNNALQTDPTTERLTGTVHISEGCGTLIHAKAGKQKLVIFPNNLDEKYQVEGMKISFYFKNSSIPVPVKCVADARGNVEEVESRK